MKKIRSLKVFGLVTILTFALVFIVFNFVQGQVKTQARPDKPPGKEKGSKISMDAISGWPGCSIEYPDTFYPIPDDPGIPSGLVLPPNLLLIDTRFDVYPKCWNGGADVPLDSNRTFIIDFNSNPCMHYSEMIINVPPERADYGWDELFRGEMSAIRNEIGEIVEISILFYDQDGWGYETEAIAVEPVMPNSDYFVISVCRTNIPIFPRGHKKYWKDWGVDPVNGLGLISIGDTHFIPRPPRNN